MPLKKRTTAIARRLNKLLDEPDTEQAELLRRLACQLALAEEAQDTLESEGLWIQTTYTTKSHPAIAVLHNATLCAIKLFTKLGIEQNEVEQFADLGI